MPSLYTISGELENALDVLDECGEEIPDQLLARIDELTGDFSRGVYHLCLAIRQFEAEGEAVKSELQRLALLQDHYARRARFLKAYIQRSMEQTGQRKLDLPLFRLSVCRNSRPTIACAGDPPVAFTRTKKELDKEAVYEAWRLGVELPASITVTEGNHLRIR
jgi:hypothetical protein